MAKANNRKFKRRVRGKGSQMLEDRISKQAMKMSMMGFGTSSFDQYNTGNSIFAANALPLYTKTKQDFNIGHFDQPDDSQFKTAQAHQESLSSQPREIYDRTNLPVPKGQRFRNGKDYAVKRTLKKGCQHLLRMVDKASVTSTESFNRSPSKYQQYAQQQAQIFMKTNSLYSYDNSKHKNSSAINMSQSTALSIKQPTSPKPG